MKRQRGYLSAVELFFVAVLALGLALMIWSSVTESRDWQRFSTEHKCKVVAKVSGSTGTGFSTTVGANGHVGIGPTVVSIPGKTGYLCDDGITYWR